MPHVHVPGRDIVCDDTRKTLSDTPIPQPPAQLFDNADSLGIKKIEVLDLLEGAARVVAHLPADQIPGAMEALTGSIIATLEQALAQGQREPLITGLSRLAVFFKRVNIPRVPHLRHCFGPSHRISLL